MEDKMYELGKAIGTFNDGISPLISIVMVNHNRKSLTDRLEAIFGQELIANFEVVVLDNATTDGSWEVAHGYMLRYPNRVTLSRNPTPLELATNVHMCLQLAKGKYYVEMTREIEFDPEYIRQAIIQLECDPLVMYSYIAKKKDFRLQKYGCHRLAPESKLSSNSLVRICIYNYNYGRFLNQCLESVAAQTYKNIEISFSDNASTDHSWDVALEFSKKYSNRIYLTRNRTNFGPGNNLQNCWINNKSKYTLILCSDDVLVPDFIERCVTLLECYPEAAFAMVHRDIIDEENHRSSEPSFYDQTCLIGSEEQTAVYMMAAVNPSLSQILYDWEKFQSKLIGKDLTGRWFGSRMVDFNLSAEYPIIYIKEPLLLHRVHSMSDGASIDDNLIQCMGQYILLHQFVEIASDAGLSKAVDKLGDAIVKVGMLCLRYCVRALLKDDEFTAHRYLHLAQAIYPEIVADTTFQRMREYLNLPVTRAESRSEILATLKSQPNLAIRSISYPPPHGSIVC